MGSKVYLIDHLNADELYQRYREEQDPIKRTHLQILWLLTSGRPAKVAAEMTGYSQRWISVLVGRYNEAGVGGLGDLRRFNPGSRPLLETPLVSGGSQARARMAQICSGVKLGGVPGRGASANRLAAPGAGSASQRRRHKRTVSTEIAN